MRRTTILLTFLLVLMAAGVGLQVFLSRRVSRWPGLVLPGICLLYSLALCLNVAAGPGAVAGGGGTVACLAARRVRASFRASTALSSGRRT